MIRIYIVCKARVVIKIVINCAITDMNVANVYARKLRTFRSQNIQLNFNCQTETRLRRKRVRAETHVFIIVFTGS